MSFIFVACLTINGCQPEQKELPKRNSMEFGSAKITATRDSFVVIQGSKKCGAYQAADETSSIYRFSRIEERITNELQGESEIVLFTTDLMQAVASRDLKKVKSIIDTGAAIDEVNEGSCTALLWAASLGDGEIVTALIDAGADTDLSDAAGISPLMLASKAGNAEIVQKLLAAGADANAAQTGGINEVGTTALHSSATRRADNSEVIRLLIQAGADADAQNQHGKTPLFDAAYSGRIENVRALLVGGADAQHISNSGHKAIDAAYRFPEIERLLTSGIE